MLHYVMDFLIMFIMLYILLHYTHYFVHNMLIMCVFSNVLYYFIIFVCDILALTQHKIPLYATSSVIFNSNLTEKCVMLSRQNSITGLQEINKLKSSVQDIHVPLEVFE